MIEHENWARGSQQAQKVVAASMRFCSAPYTKSLVVCLSIFARIYAYAHNPILRLGFQYLGQQYRLAASSGHHPKKTSILVSHAPNSSVSIHYQFAPYRGSAASSINAGGWASTTSSKSGSWFSLPGTTCTGNRAAYLSISSSASHRETVRRYYQRGCRTRVSTVS
jgi:hypothetical protein